MHHKFRYKEQTHHEFFRESCSELVAHKRHDHLILSFRNIDIALSNQTINQSVNQSDN